MPVKRSNNQVASLVALGAALRELREQRGLHQAVVAERADLSVGYLSGLENGKRNPTFSVIATLADVLRVSVLDVVQLAERNGQQAVRAFATEEVSYRRAPGWNEGIPRRRAPSRDD